jgi:hypothetical protein
MAQTGHGPVHCTHPLSGVKRTWRFDVAISAFASDRLFRWDTRGKKPNDPVEGFNVPLFCELLIRLRWRSPLGTATLAIRGKADMTITLRGEIGLRLGRALTPKYARLLV